MTFKFAVDDAKSWKSSIDAIVNLIDEGNLEVGKDGITLRAMDPSQIAMISFSMPKGAFIEYSVAATARLGLNFDSLSKILGRTRGSETLEVSGEENKLVLRFASGKRKRSFKVPLLDLPAGAQKEPSIQHDATVKINGGQFKETLRDAALVSSHVSLEAGTEGFIVEVHGDSGDLKVESEKESEEIVEIKASGSSKATFPLQYLEDIVKACPDSSVLSIHLKSNAPVKIEYEVGSSKLSYYLAPRIDSD
jgi:proliferating cell nuclear antigen